MQALFLIRPAEEAFRDFMDPSVLFIFGSMVIGMVFTKTGLTKRMAYKMLAIVGERTSMIYLGCFVRDRGPDPHHGPHRGGGHDVSRCCWPSTPSTARATSPTKFGKGLFIGMAYVAGAGSIITLLGSARGAVAIGFFKDMHRQGDLLLRAAPTTCFPSAG